MKTILGVSAMALLAFLAWTIGARLSADAVGMGVGLLFGVMAGVPSALLVLAAGRPRHDGEFDADEWRDGYTRGREAGKLFAPFQKEPFRCPTCLTLFSGDHCPECGDQRQWPYDDANLWRNDGTPRRDIVVHPARRVYTAARPFGRLVTVQRVTTGSNGVQVAENHLLPPEVAAQLYGELATFDGDAGHE